MGIKTYLTLFLISLTFSIKAQVIYPDNEEGRYEDMLTPQYYNTTVGQDFRLEVNKFVHFARMTDFQHPFSDPSGKIQEHTTGRGFGAGIGPGGAGSHHPAIDYYPKNSNTGIDLYAAFDGTVKYDKTVNRYRHFLSITKQVKDSSGESLGKMMVIYAHIDLDLDAADNISLDGKTVKKGDLVSKNLYAGTMGGPHLHFEIRYYRPTDKGDEDFYGGQTPEKTVPSAGIWTFGFWNPQEGYGFANPLNHLKQESPTGAEELYQKKINFYPNPVNQFLTIDFENSPYNSAISLISMQGIVLYRNVLRTKGDSKIDMGGYEKGIYLLRLVSDEDIFVNKIIKE